MPKTKMYRKHEEKEPKEKTFQGSYHTPPIAVNPDKKQLPLNIDGCNSSSSLSNQSLDRIPEYANKVAN